MKDKSKKIKKSWDNRIFMLVTVIIVLLLAATCIVPFVYLLALSLSGEGAVMRGEVFLWPKEFTTQVYESIFNDGTLLAAMRRTILLTVAYVVVCMVMTVLCAYPLSIGDLKGKKIIMAIVMFSMYFSGGLIPGYLLVSGLGLIDSYWALILPGALSTYNMIVLRTAFAGIPTSLKEAALIDGAGDLIILTKIVLPLSKATLATVALFYMVARWNAVQDSMLYINDPAKYVVQARLKEMLLSMEAVEQIMQEGDLGFRTPPETIRSGSLVFSIIPVMIVYPFLQKYFVKGTMIGSVKG